MSGHTEHNIASDRKSLSQSAKRPARGARVKRVVFVSLAFGVAASFAFLNVLGGYPSSNAAPGANQVDRFHGEQPQQAGGGTGYVLSAPREGYTAEKKVEVPSQPASKAGATTGFAAPRVVGNLTANQSIAHELLLARGWGEDQFGCLVDLWAHESGWRENAGNLSSGAYGIPQALPGIKMATAGPDWETNPATQIKWGLGYIAGRYGTPCAAFNHWQQKNFY